MEIIVLDDLIILHCPFLQFQPNLNPGSKKYNEAQSPPDIQIVAIMNARLIFFSQKFPQNAGFIRLIHLDNAMKLND